MKTEISPSENAKNVIMTTTKCNVCGVPDNLHGTCCGWRNAKMVYYPWEKFVIANPSAEERELRYLMSTSQNELLLARYYTTARLTEATVTTAANP